MVINRTEITLNSISKQPQMTTQSHNNFSGFACTLYKMYNCFPFKYNPKK